MSLSRRLHVFFVVGIGALCATGAGAQVCFPGGFHGWTPTGTTPNAPNCLGLFACYAPLLEEVEYVTVGGCDPTSGPCTVRGQVHATFRGNHHNASVFFGTSPVNFTWSDSGGGFVGTCGQAGAAIFEDVGDAWIQAGNFSCGDPGAATGTDTYSLRVRVCNGATGCLQSDVTVPVPLTPAAMVEGLCPPPPVQDDCGDGSTCQACIRPGGMGGAGAGVGGTGPSAGGDGSGPAALLRYRAGGVGSAGQPGTAAWNPTLGRYWSHSYAERIVEEGSDVAWLLTRRATFVRFEDGNADDVYELVSPEDDYRTLEKLGDGSFELRDLDGTVDRFDATGKWTEREDRAGNTRVATYTAGVLTQVDFPDGRREDFAYHGSGKLASITEVGVGGSPSRTWSYTWSGDDLVAIDRPDGTALEYRYDDPSLAGYLTRITLVGTDASERIDAAFAHDSEGNVVTTWRGTAGPSDPGVVDKWALSFDDPTLPTVTTVTDPLGQVSTYTLDARTHRNEKPRLLELEGSCPTCGLGPNSQLTYGDVANPFRPTEEVDGDGTVTLMTYDANGQMTSRVEAFGTALERETTWEYDTTFPAFATEVVRPSATGNPLDERRTSTVYDADGNATSQTIEGFEDGSPFSFATISTYNTAGQPTAIDPPGFGTADETSFTYDPTRGDLVALTRTDPVVGTTSFDYDEFNRRTSTTDPNAVETTTEYDALDRVTETTQLGAIPAEDLVTEQVYDVFGDLFRTILPRGNVIEYGYDDAGRLVTIERRPDTSTHGERTLYTLDAMGHRTKEELQRWNGSTWVTESFTDFVYSTRCHLDRIVHADGSVTEYDYDCDGNLEREWDANHPSAGQTNPATRVYAYDDLDRLTSVTEPWGGAGGGTAATSYGYDVQDHLLSVTDAEGNETTYEYSDRDLMTEEDSPVSGVTSHEYDEHGSLASTTDARAVTTTRTYDAADRVTLVDYPDAALDTTYVYDDVGVPFSKGRLTAITRDGESVDYAYDRFGRLTVDGELAYGHDANGNRVTIGYPGGVTATYTFDFADRESTLEVDDGVASQSVVTSASYLPSGPPNALTLGNAVTESRLFDARYFPTSIEATTSRDHTWAYTTDDVGNPTAIVETEGCEPTVALANQTLAEDATIAACDTITAGPNVTVASNVDVTFQAGQSIGLNNGFAVASTATFSAAIGEPSPVVASRTFGYQDVQYFLTSADGAPWGALDWTYDKIGNRLTEDRNSAVDTYTYLSNGSGNTAILEQAGSRAYTTGPAGHVTQIAAGANVIDLAIDDAGRVAGFERAVATAETSLAYDGRGYLRRSEKLLAGGPNVGFTEPTYSSDGLLHALHRQLSPSDPEERVSLLYFAGRPVAQLRQEIAGPSTWLFLSTDHLGTPTLATDLAGDEVWHGPLEPFGADFFRGSTESALAKEVSLRFPGQLEDETWEDATLGAETYYNVFRWYEASTGRYTSPDPLFFTLQDVNPFAYTGGNPMLNIDPLGLQTYHCTRELGSPPAANTSPPPVVNHQYACIWEEDGSSTCNSTSAQEGVPFMGRGVQQGVGGNPDDLFDLRVCRQIEPRNHCFEDCLKEQWQQPRRTYAIGWRGEDCQEYTDRVVDECRQRCNALGLPGAVTAEP